LSSCSNRAQIPERQITSRVDVLLQDQSLEMCRTELHGFAQLGVRTSRTIVGGISALPFSMLRYIKRCSWTISTGLGWKKCPYLMGGGQSWEGYEIAISWRWSSTAHQCKSKRKCVAEAIQHACLPFANVRWLPRSS
jgi:hypothetical protein